MSMAKSGIGGTIPGWFTVLLLGVVCFLLKNYTDAIDRTLDRYNVRITTIEMWKAGIQGTEKK